QALEKGRAAALAARPREEALKEVRRLIGLPGPVAAARVREAGKLRHSGDNIGKRGYETEPGGRVPALEVVPDKVEENAPLTVYLHGGGKAADAAPGGPMEKLVRAGHRVLSLDLRGTGETAPGVPPKGRPGFFGVDAKEAFLGLHLLRPLLG